MKSEKKKPPVKQPKVKPAGRELNDKELSKTSGGGWDVTHNIKY